MILTFAILIPTWFSYQWYPYLDRWPPRILDSVIPFSPGISQGILASSLRKETLFFLGIFLTGVFGTVAYINTWNNIDKSDFNPEEVYAHHLAHLKKSKNFSIASAIYGLIVFILCVSLKIDRLLPMWVFLIPVSVFVVKMFSICSIYYEKILDEFKIEAWKIIWTKILIKGRIKVMNI